jgi:outer membrane protein TolC
MGGSANPFPANRLSPPVRSTIAKKPTWIVAALLLSSLPALAAPFTLEDAIHTAWKHSPGIAASAEMVAAAQADADSAGAGRLPTLMLSAKALATKEPVAAFGLKLDEQRITAADFDPSRLNSPDLVGGVGFGAMLVQPLYMGGRITAGQQAAADQAEAEVNAHRRRVQELAFNVVQAYFGTQVAAEGVRHSEDVLGQARETESFTKSRNQQGLALDADVARTTAFRAQAEADRAAAVQRLDSARAMLALLTGQAAMPDDLVTPLRSDGPAVGESSTDRADLEAARLRTKAARTMVQVTKGSLLPEVTAQASVETMRSDFTQGATWYSVGLMARWRLSLVDLRSTRAAERRAGAAEQARQWQELQARHEVEESRRLLETSRSRLASAREAVAAAQSARSLRLERHRQGLLPLTEVLDAEAALAGARALLLRCQFEARVASAQVQFALGNPIEGVKQ